MPGPNQGPRREMGNRNHTALSDCVCACNCGTEVSSDGSDSCQPVRMPCGLPPDGDTTPPQVLIQLSKAGPEALIPNTLPQQPIFQQGQSVRLCNMSGTQSTQILRELSLKGEALSATCAITDQGHSGKFGGGGKPYFPTGPLDKI